MTRISNDYADALFSLASEYDIREEIALSLEKVSEVLERESDYLSFLASPAIHAKERTDALIAAFGGSIHDTALDFLCVLCEHGHIREYSECVAQYRHLLNESKRTCTAFVKSAVPLTEEQKSALTEKLSKRLGKSVSLSLSIDESLLGGMVVEADGKILDGSIKSRLNHMKEVILS